MSILYKYSSNLGAGFVDNPTLKISIPAKLNDPFENNWSDHIKKYIAYCHGDAPEIAIENSVFLAEMFCNFFGIISLSETNRNSLMWAHYANNHSGMCVGVEESFLSHKANETIQFSNCADIKGTCKPIKVKYDNLRFDMDEHDIIKYDNSMGKWYESFIIKQLSIKSDEWMYEKEHRSIIPVSHMDEVIIKKRMRSREMCNFLRKGEAEGTIESIGLERFRILGELEKKILIHMSSDDKGDDITFLCKIPPQKVTSIHLGVNFDKQTKAEMINKLKRKRHPLKNIKLYQKSISNERFELNSELIYSPDM
ncbi:TPA: DUF2971 domain-containing protein [Aeromonas veronii]|nr:DUF2971 domain-containing protein [Aeromonas veronii]